MYELTFIDEITGDIIKITNDFMSYVRINDIRMGSFASLFPNCSINWHAGYMVKADGTIVCSTECNQWIGQFEGCKEVEINNYKQD